MSADTPTRDPKPGAALPALALTRQQKAALVVRLALSEGADLPLADLPPAAQRALAEQMARLAPPDQSTLDRVAEEFGAALAAGPLMGGRGAEAAIRLLEGRIGEEALAALRPGGLRPADPWLRIAGMSAEMLIPIVERESPEVAAVIVGRIPVETAASVLAAVPGPHARRVAYAVSRTAAAPEPLAARIGAALLAELTATPPPPDGDGAAGRVGAILTAASAATREEVLAGLGQQDGAFAEAVRRAIFTFADIPARVAPRDVATLLRGFDEEALVAALAGGEASGFGAVTAFLLDNVSKRLSERLRERIAEAPPMPPEEAEAAMASIGAEVRRLAAAGEIILAKPA